MKIGILSVFLIVLSGCNGVYAQANDQAVAGSPSNAVVRQLQRPVRSDLPNFSVGCPPGTPMIKCGQVRNGLGDGLAIVLLRVNDEAPIVMNPNGGTLPLPRLLNGQTTDFIWPRCTRRNIMGECLYKFVGIAYPVVDMRGEFPDVDPNSEDAQLFVQADLDPHEAICFEMEIPVTLNMRQNRLFVPSIQPEWVLRECPSGMVPKGTTFAVRQ